ncbi:MAG TPA: hypothetical protein VHC90_13470, partial [Bryobacteraceae bacterium]|nr:hypothetical protein [Bryobacteraceae bacterium]
MSMHMRVAIVFLMLAAAVTAQPVRQFDAASVRVDNGPPIPGVSGVIKGGPGSSDPGRFSYTQQLLKVIVMYAYDLPAHRIQ